MKSGIEVKSFLIGVLATLCVVLLGAAAHSTNEAVPWGRFQMAMNEGCALLYDSTTGQVWCASPGSVGRDANFKDVKIHLQKPSPAAEE